jgi:hypothetical protein
LSGNFGGSRGGATINLDAALPLVDVHQDIDSIGIYSRNIPVSYEHGHIFINTIVARTDGVTSKSHVGFQLDGEEEYSDIGTTPNYMFGKFGDLGRFSVSDNLLHHQMFGQWTNIFIHTHLLLLIYCMQVAICFPTYTLPENSDANRRPNGLHRVRGSDIGYFVDNVVLPSIHRVYSENNLSTWNAITPFFQEQEFLAYRTDNNQVCSSGNTISSSLWPQLEETMRRRITEIDPDFGHQFNDFFFFSFSHGTKSNIGPNSNSFKDSLERTFTDLDWPRIDTHNVFVDLGFEFHQEGHAGFWRLSRPRR